MSATSLLRSRMAIGLSLSLLSLQLMCSSSRTGQATTHEPTTVQATSAGSATPSNPSAPASTPSAGKTLAPAATPQPFLLLTKREALQALERQGLDLGTLLFAKPSAVTARDLSELRGYQDIIREIGSALDTARQRDRSLGEGMTYSHRAFPKQWLSSASFHYELVGIVNRMDRRVFAPSTCGEIRFIYRLAYQATVQGMEVSSRVPMTLNVVAWLGGADCRAWLDKLSFMEGNTPDFSSDVFQSMRLKSVEVNLQSARWPSAVRPSMAGHAEYVLRVFHPLVSEQAPSLGPAPHERTGGFRVSSLENTPDVALLQRQPAARNRLLEWLTQPAQLAQIDRGTVLLPEEFLAHAALSIAPHGMARLANRPFAQVFKEETFKTVDLTSYATFKTPAELLRRLDGLTCTGCHQARSIAGFHLLGEDDPARRVDALAVGHSPHLSDELRRRRDYLQALSQGRAPDDFRPPAERPRNEGGYGEACQLNAVGWNCAAGLSCMVLTDAQWGQCLPSAPQAGSACEPGSMSLNTNPHRDFLKLAAATDCGAYAVCEHSGVGFPSGMCAKACAGLKSGERCGSIAVLDGFNTCLARHEPFEQCIQDHARPAALRACSDTEPCRDDYACARTKDRLGACIPPYFLFQLRVDGHVLP